MQTIFFPHICFDRLYDVRGQQSVRRKWLHCFEGIQAVVFVVALNSYDKTLQEDPSVVCYKVTVITQIQGNSVLLKSKAGEFCTVNFPLSWLESAAEESWTFYIHLYQHSFPGNDHGKFVCT